MGSRSRSCSGNIVKKPKWTRSAYESDVVHELRQQRFNVPIPMNIPQRLQHRVAKTAAATTISDSPAYTWCFIFEFYAGSKLAEQYRTPQWGIPGSAFLYFWLGLGRRNFALHESPNALPPSCSWWIWHRFWGSYTWVVHHVFSNFPSQLRNGTKIEASRRCIRDLLLCGYEVNDSLKLFSILLLFDNRMQSKIPVGKPR